jgi:hypothetical protein
MMRPVVEEIPDADAVYRQVDFPSMYREDAGLIWDVIFQFPNGEHESLVWAKYVPTQAAVHELGHQRVAEALRQRPERPKEYVGYLPSTAGRIREIRTKAGHGFLVRHDPPDGIHHVAVDFKPAKGGTLNKGEKAELKLALKNVFGPLVPDQKNA